MILHPQWGGSPENRISYLDQAMRCFYFAWYGTPRDIERVWEQREIEQSRRNADRAAEWKLKLSLR